MNNLVMSYGKDDALLVIVFEYNLLLPPIEPVLTGRFGRVGGVKLSTAATD